MGLELRWRLIDVRERTLDSRGERDPQRAAIDVLQQIANALDDDRRRGEVAWRRSSLAMRTADYRSQESASREAMALAERVGDATLKLRAQQVLALALHYSGNDTAAQELAQRGLAEARELGLRAIESKFLNALSIIVMQHDPSVAAELGWQQLAIDRELGNARDEAITLGNLAVCLTVFGEHTQSARLLEEGLRLARMVGDRDAELIPLYILSELALRRGNFVQALAHAQSALDTAVAVENPPLETLALFALGNAELARGHYPAAKSAFERAQRVTLAIGSSMELNAVAGLARVAMAEGDLALAMTHVESVLARTAETRTLTNTESPHLIRLVCYQVLAHAGDRRAAAVLATAHAELQAEAAAIADSALRESFLTEIPEQREIVAAWAAATATAK